MKFGNIFDDPYSDTSEAYTKYQTVLHGCSFRWKNILISTALLWNSTTVTTLADIICIDKQKGKKKNGQKIALNKFSICHHVQNVKLNPTKIWPISDYVGCFYMA